jgi:glycosyltransferase involved in cell wall biosynthesis
MVNTGVDISSENSVMITTIIPTYQRPKLLERAILSVLNQTHTNLQVCVYDNASGDETDEVVRRLMENDSRLKYHCHEKNIGAFDNFTYGMKNINTKYFSILSDDDFVLPDFFETALKGFEKHPEVMLSACATIHSTLEGRVIGMPLSAWDDGLYMPPEGAMQMIEKKHPEWTGIIFRKEVLDTIGYLDREIGRSSDLYFELCIAWRFSIYVIKKAGAVFVNHAEGSIAKAHFYDTWISHLNIIDRVRADERLSSDVRLKSAQLLKNKLKKEIWHRAVKDSISGNNSDVFLSIEFLSKLPTPPVQVFLLKLVVNICLYIPLVGKLINFYFSKRRQKLDQRWKSIISDFDTRIPTAKFSSTKSNIGKSYPEKPDTLE